MILLGESLCWSLLGIKGLIHEQLSKSLDRNYLQIICSKFINVAGFSRFWFSKETELVKKLVLSVVQHDTPLSSKLKEFLKTT